MKKPAFTLLELLLVITIIGVLTSILVLNFSAVRQRQQLLLMADQAVAMLQQARAEVSSGKVDGEFFLCEGAFFEEGEAPVQALAFYDSEHGRCDFSTFKTQLYGLSTGEAEVSEMELGGMSVSELWALYIPPEGKVQFYSETGEIMSGEARVHFAHTSLNLPVSIQISPVTNLVTLSLNDEE